MEKKDVAEWVKFGLENEENKKKAIKAACFIIGALNSGKKISDEDIKKIAAAGGCFMTSMDQGGHSETVGG